MSEYGLGARILVVEDDEDLSFIIMTQLTANGFLCDAAMNKGEIVNCLSENQYDLVILDMMLPDTDGIEVCKLIRETSKCPIIFASCVVDHDAMIEALSVGGDDYIVKPVDIDLLVARIRANLRRCGYEEKNSKIISFGDYEVDTSKYEVWRVNEKKARINQVMLSATEYKILLHFLTNKDQLLLYEELYRCIWESDDLGDTRTVMVHVSNLRKKIEDETNGFIHTVRGAGYIFSIN